MSRVRLKERLAMVERCAEELRRMRLVPNNFMHNRAYIIDRLDKMDSYSDAQILKEFFGKLNYLSEWNILIEGDNIYRVSGTKIIKITLIDFIQAYSNVLYIAKSGTMVTVLNEDIERLKINRLWMIINGEKIKIVSTNPKNKGLVILITPNNNIRRIHYINLYTADEYIKGAKKLRSGMSTKRFGIA